MASAGGSEGEDCYVGLLETGNPSEVKDDYWIWAVNRTIRNNRKPERSEVSKCGKWLIFEPVDRIDDAWKTVKKGVVNGDFGFLAKVSTMKDKEERGKAFESVICVYTYDWTDEEDVSRVRQELRLAGFEKKLPYKTDEDTLAGNYAGKRKRVSKYYY